MIRGRTLLISVVGVAVAASWGATRARASIEQETTVNLLDTVTDSLKDLIMTDWQARAAKPENQNYVTAAHAAEDRYGLPRDLIVRQIWQESRFRDGVISGEVKGGAGEVGILQIIPAMHPDVNPYDPLASIDYAAKWISQLRDQFGGLKEALTAYNWGPGNLKKFGIDAAPRSTVSYYTGILGDIGALA